ncbi:MAG: ankyrin repeat domain-containing protein [Candidatus Hydrogenedentes bacterium]|nr:ankyrin repeat domain-containing protein [Candidatus Hydrogenedentota bacterium]
MAQFLIDRGADVNASCCDYPKTVLEHALKFGDLPKIKLLLDAGANMGWKRPSGYDVMMASMERVNGAFDENLFPIVRHLIDRGVPANRVTIHGESAVHYASSEGRFDIVKLLLAAGAPESALKWTDVMRGIALGSQEDVQSLLVQGADQTARDSCGRTPWLLCAQTGDVAKAKLLLVHGANPDDRDRLSYNALFYAIMNDRPEMLSWLINQGLDVNEVLNYHRTPLRDAAEAGASRCVQRLIEAGADISELDDFGHPPIEQAETKEVVKLLVAAGADLCDINDEMRARLTGFEDEGYLDVSRDDYFQGRYPRFGNANAELMKVEFWNAMVRSGVTAYCARQEFEDTESYDDRAVWCFKRFGKSITELPDGRFIEIGGEHEDHYDEDFYIYNDVVVHHGNGRFEIYGYPKEMFPPTDFHSATLVGDYIYIIGGLGYRGERRFGETLVYRLHCDGYTIEPVETSAENPGWICRHKGKLDGNSIVISGGKVSSMGPEKEEYDDNFGRYALDLSSMRWSRVTG